MSRRALRNRQPRRSIRPPAPRPSRAPSRAPSAVPISLASSESGLARELSEAPVEGEAQRDEEATSPRLRRVPDQDSFAGSRDSDALDVAALVSAPALVDGPEEPAPEEPAPEAPSPAVGASQSAYDVEAAPAVSTAAVSTDAATPTDTTPDEAGSEPVAVGESGPATITAGERVSEDDLLMADPGTYEFFSRSPAAGAPLVEDETASWLPAASMSAESRRSMRWTLSMLLASLVGIGGYLVYHKLLMPTPVPLAGGQLDPASALLPMPPPALEPEPEAAVPLSPTSPETATRSTAVTAAAGDGPAQAPAAVAAAGPVELPAEPPTDEAEVAEPAPASAAYLARMQEAADLQKKGDLERALSAYEGVLVEHPGAAEALAKVAYLHLNGRRFADAGAYAERAVTADPTSSEGWIVLGAARQATGKRAEARAAYRSCAAQAVGEYVTECRRMAR